MAFMITDTTNFWIYVLTYDQWEIIQNNINNKKFYVSAFNTSDIKTDDILFFYQRPDGLSKPGGFVLVGDTSMDMIENDGTLDPDNPKNASGHIKVFNDINMNQYVTQLRDIRIFETPVKTSMFAEQIEESDSSFKSSRHFTQATIRGDCNFVLLNSKDLGNRITGKMQEIFAESTSSKTKIEIDTNSSELSIEIDDIQYSIDESDEDEFIIKPNIPIMLVPCKELPKDIVTLKKHSNIVQMIYHHYLHCEECDITNNGPRELSDSIKSVKLSNVKYDVDNHVDILVSYLMDDTYPRSINQTIDSPKEKELSHQITFHRCKSDPIYSECIIIEFTSKVKNMILASKAIMNANKIKQKDTKRVNAVPKNISKVSKVKKPLIVKNLKREAISSDKRKIKL
jgi:hypothetical protein